jgi:hypothetical protein
MNFRTQFSSRVTFTKLLLAVFLLMTTTAFDCTFSDDILFPAPPPFPGGIRIETQEGLANLPVGGIPIGNVPNSGVLTQILGPGTGFATDFAGPTNANGIRLAFGEDQFHLDPSRYIHNRNRGMRQCSTPGSIYSRRRSLVGLDLSCVE